MRPDEAKRPANDAEQQRFAYHEEKNRSRPVAEQADRAKLNASSRAFRRCIRLWDISRGGGATMENARAAQLRLLRKDNDETRETCSTAAVHVCDLRCDNRNGRRRVGSVRPVRDASEAPLRGAGGTGPDAAVRGCGKRAAVARCVVRRRASESRQSAVQIERLRRRLGGPHLFG